MYQTLELKLMAQFPDIQIKVQKTQITFSNKHPFAFVWLPIRKVKNRPEVYFVVSFVLSHPIESPRIVESVEPHPDRWTHHLIFQKAEDLDEQLLGWIQEAYNFAERKSSLHHRIGGNKVEPDRQQSLRNPDVVPTQEVLKNELKDAYEPFLQFLNKLENHQMQLEWRYYSDGKAWLGKGLFKWVGIRGGQKVRTIFWLSVWDGFFKVTVYLPENVRVAAMVLPIDVETIEKISQAKSMGKLHSFPIVFEIQNEVTLDGLFSVIEFKKTLK